ncbi:MAG: hypothetical protein LBH44_09410 [Treponema sp.]|jgi:hypothetical protein|nr:hypothetical protein [Treponema sp.]
MSKFCKPMCIWGLFVVFLPLLSCAARINGSLAADGSASLSVGVSLEPKMTDLIRKLSDAGGQAGRILDGAAITQSMSKAPGIASVSLQNTAPAAIEGPIRISKVSEFLAIGNSRKFISFEQGGLPGAQAGGRCVISISRETGPEIIGLLSPEIVDYLNALMAPLATEEELTRAEYLDLVASVYNKSISDEISGSRIRASLDFPGSVTSVKGGTFSGRKAEFNLPLLDILVLETPLVYEVNWK